MGLWEEFPTAEEYRGVVLIPNVGGHDVPSQATTSDVFSGAPGEAGELVCAAGSPPGDRVLLQPLQGLLRGKGKYEHVFLFSFIFIVLNSSILTSSPRNQIGRCLIGNNSRNVPVPDSGKAKTWFLLL